MAKNIPTTGPEGVITLNLGKPGSKGSKVVKVAPAVGLIKTGAQKRLMHPAHVFGSMPKGEARKVRKLLAANGFSSIAAHKRAA
jgi:hypothetical protein